MKKWKLISMAALAAITLTACQNDDDKDTGMGNVEPTRYNNTDNNLVHRNSDNTMDVDDRQKNGDDQQPRYQVADDVAKKVKEVEGVDDAYVFTTDNNAFVAVDMKNDDDNSGNNGMGNTATGDNNNNDVTDKVKKDVEKAVRSVDEDIDNVYVSADPDFLGMAKDYNNKIDEGQPVKGFFLEFGNMLNRVFPNNER
ncbi:YhcN/YlaJ family sporulation lipoprotein [Terribacillus saccharophilus]|uniref:Sporulation lipoprotein, YhcN/YlaJ family n=1 Tax=Terribacillus saccharophilus TaxID=361277 RepID=A0AAX2EE75_9BACI|nr:YhcN/YlaJ family sporulation lipoprotein [Terribacillus goriensis]MEC0281106.1 YhcN/YlaJ family sporulation lipoprotein [Terribacillus saccharophilus]MEC0289306.1 YhcN/YlaJ family sporulation lipoprotein [Terribacillus saccharophilus]SEM92638.1 sporulation lipoprotein, YhcN/YlaJ family [Terribacillus saccharophilus]